MAATEARQCSSSRCVWALVDDNIVDHMRATRESNAKQWLFALIATLKHEDLVTVVVTLWAIWHARRKSIHEDIHQSPMTTHLFINQFIKELEDVGKQRPQTQQGSMSTRPSAIPRQPRPGTVKIFSASGRARSGDGAAAAAFVRDEEGRYMGSSALVVAGVKDEHCLSAISCREAQALAQDLMLQHIIIACEDRSLLEI